MSRRQTSVSDQPLPEARPLTSGPERVVLVGAERPRGRNGHGDRARFLPEESLDELARLSETAGLEVTGRVVQTLREGIHPDGQGRRGEGPGDGNRYQRRDF